MARAYFQIYFSSRRVLLEKLTDTQRGRVLTAAFDYAELGRLPTELDAQEDIAFETLRVWIDKNKDHYEKEAAQNQKNGKITKPRALLGRDFAVFWVFFVLDRFFGK